MMSRSRRIRSRARARESAGSAGLADLLGAYIRSPEASWPMALRATYWPPPIGAPQAPIGCGRSRPPALDQRRQVLPDAVYRLARRGHAVAPDPDQGPARAVDRQAGQTAPQP